MRKTGDLCEPSIQLDYHHFEIAHGLQLRKHSEALLERPRLKPRELSPLRAVSRAVRAAFANLRASTLVRLSERRRR